MALGFDSLAVPTRDLEQLDYKQPGESSHEVSGIPALIWQLLFGGRVIYLRYTSNQLLY